MWKACKTARALYRQTKGSQPLTRPYSKRVAVPEIQPGKSKSEPKSQVRVLSPKQSEFETQKTVQVRAHNPAFAKGKTARNQQTLKAREIATGPAVARERIARRDD